MYICVCRGISEEQLKRQIKEGHGTKEILKNLGVGDDCGVCVVTAIDRIQSWSGEKTKVQPKSIKV